MMTEGEDAEEDAEEAAEVKRVSFLTRRLKGVLTRRLNHLFEEEVKSSF